MVILIFDTNNNVIPQLQIISSSSE